MQYFICYIIYTQNQQHYRIYQHRNRKLHVDNFGITYSSPNMPTLERQMQNCLNKIEKLTNENCFQFSKIKTVCIHFSKRRTYHLNTEINIDGYTIPAVPQAKYLGIIFDDKLKFKAHIEYQQQKCLNDLKLLKNIKNELWYRPQSHA